MFQHVYLSPHYDDASLSCGGTIHRQVQSGGSVLVVTIFAAVPSALEPLSPFAADIHTRWDSPENLVATRQAEDQCSLAVLGVDYLRLHFLDCIYRGKPRHSEWYYNNKTELFGQVHPAEVLLFQEIIDAITITVPYEQGVTLYAPLTVGHHVDHQLIYTVACRLKSQGWPVVFYEDYPYVDPIFAGQDSPYSLEATLAGLTEFNFQPELSYFSAKNLKIKVASIAAYTSQLDTLFGGEMAMEKQVSDYTRTVGENNPAERFWLPK